MGWPKIKKIRWPKPPKWLPPILRPDKPGIPHIPNPIKDLEKAAREAGKAAEDAAHVLGKAVDDVVHLPEKAAAELQRNLEKLGEARSRVTKAAAKAVHDVVDAGEAVARFGGRELKDTLEAAEAASKGNVLESAWDFATSRIKSTSDNASQAMGESAVLAVAAQVAASAYGGPAGSAAFSAWMAYQAGGDLNMALRVGVTQGLMAAATVAAGKLPLAQEQLAKGAINGALAKLKGESSEAALRESLVSLVDISVSHLPVGELGAIQRSLVTGAAGGLAVAAAGGNHEAITKAFLASGGKVLVQDVKAAARDITAQAEETLAAAVSSVVSPEQVAAIEGAVASAKALKDSEAARMVAEARSAAEPYLAPAKAAAEAAEAQAKSLRDGLLKTMDEAAARAQSVADAALQERETIEKLREAAAAQVEAHRQAALAASKPAEQIDTEAKNELALVNDKAAVGLAAVAAEEKKAKAAADNEIADAKARLNALGAQAIEWLPDLDRQRVRVLAGTWVLSWDDELLEPSDTIGAVLTFAGAGSQVASALDRLGEVDVAAEQIP
jgi:hypothetical protein